MQSQLENLYDFERDIQNEDFEKIFANDYLGNNYKITDGYFPEYDIKDLDNSETYEIKRDYKWVITNNLCVEELYNVEENKKGWIYHTEADFLVIFITDELYCIINMYKLKADFFNNKKNSWICKDIKQKQGFTTRNWVKPLSFFEETFYKIDTTPLIAGGTSKAIGGKN